MANYWLEIRRRKNIVWTAEFTRFNRIMLSPRSVDLTDKLGFLGATSGKIGVIFREAMIYQDFELSRFLLEIRQGLKDWNSVLTQYKSLSKLKTHQLQDMNLMSVQIGPRPEDVNVTIIYNNLITTHYA